MLLTEAGVGLALGSWLSLLIAVLVPLDRHPVRVRVEETALRTGLGSTYERYAQGRSRLLPRSVVINPELPAG
jgi:protein-S-isoprenylcysteine O-methyltransferase Ste14